MRCMMPIGGRLAFHLSALNHCFVVGLQNFITSWSMFESSFKRLVITFKHWASASVFILVVKEIGKLVSFVQLV